MKIIRKLHSLFRRGKLDAEMSEELRAHVELQTGENIARGMSPEDARYAAQRSFGGVEQIKERARDVRRWIWFEQFFGDARFAVRGLRRSPGFAAIVLLTLALGIGANTAIFTLMNAMLLRPLPVPHPEQLVVARKVPGDASFSYMSYTRFRDRAHSLAGLATAQNFASRRWLVASDFGATQPEAVQAQVVSGNFFSVLGASASLGRALTVEDDRGGAEEGAVVLSDAFWRRRFGADPAVLGKAVRLDGALVTIVGVMPPGFVGFNPGIVPDLWWPIQSWPQVEAAQRVASAGAASNNPLTAEGWEWLVLIGRLAPNVSREAARAALGAIFQRELGELATPARLSRMTDKGRREYFGRTLELDSAGTGYTSVREPFTEPMTILMIVVGFVLLIACANVAGLLLARSAARQREFAVRSAMGAGRGRLVRQLFTESALLALAGGAIGLLFAQWGTKLLATYLPPLGQGFDLAPDARVLLFTFVVSVLTGIMFGLVPALRASRVELAAAMKQQSAQAGARSRLNAALVVAQIALSVALVAGAGLFLRTLRNLRTADLGFQRGQVTVFSLDSARAYDANQRADLHRRLLAALEAFPAVRSASLAMGGLMSGESLGTRFAIDGYIPAPDEEMRAQFMVVGPRFFETLGVPLLRGREFTASEAGGAADGAGRKVVIGETLARRFFGDADPIGRTLHSGLNSTAPVFEIVGVARDTKYRNTREQTPPEYYLPYGDGGRNFSLSFYVRTAGDPAAFAVNVRAIVRQIDPQLTVGSLRTLDEVVDATLVRERVVAQLGGFFGAFALTLASLGLYGVLSFGVVQRTREIGVRMALGARPRDVLALVVGQGVRLALLGVVAGIAAALVLTRFTEKLLFGVTAADPATFGGAAMLLLAIATLAAWLPARRAAKVDPVVALRAE